MKDALALAALAARWRGAMNEGGSMAIKYKLTTQDMTTNGVFLWELGKQYVIDNKPGTDLCSNQVFHHYDSPELAVLMNRIHANISDPRLWAVECDVVASDGLKGASKRMKLLEELPLPEVSTWQRVAFALLCALEVYDAPEFRWWARSALRRRFRLGNLAAEETAWTEAERTVVAAMESSAQLVLWSAQSAQLAIWSVRAATRSVELATRAAEASRAVVWADLRNGRAAAEAARAAETAAKAAEMAARAAERAARTGRPFNLQQITTQALAY